MGYIVNIQTGTRKKKNFTRVQSTPLANKEKVRAWVKRNPVGNVNTKVTIKNTKTNKIVTKSKGSAMFFGRNIIKEMSKK